MAMLKITSPDGQVKRVEVSGNRELTFQVQAGAEVDFSQLVVVDFEKDNAGNVEVFLEGGGKVFIAIDVESGALPDDLTITDPSQIENLPATAAGGIELVFAPGNPDDTGFLATQNGFTPFATSEADSLLTAETGTTDGPVELSGAELTNNLPLLDDGTTDNTVNPPGPVDTVAPELQTTTVSSDGLQITLAYNEALDGESDPATSDFVLTVNGAVVSISGVDAEGANVVLTLDAPITQDAEVSLDYTANPNGAPIQDVAGNDAANFTVSGETVDNTSTVPPVPPVPPEFVSAAVEGFELVLTYDQTLAEAVGSGSATAVDSSGQTVTLFAAPPADNSFTVTVDGVEVAVTNVVVYGTQVTLQLESPVSRGQDVSIDYTPGANGIAAREGGATAGGISGETVTNNTTSVELGALELNSNPEGFVIEGGTQFERAGWTVEGIGDVNGDGLDDVLVGTQNADAFVVFGKTDGAAVDLTEIATGESDQGFMIAGDDTAGASDIDIASIGDINGDGLADFIVGSGHSDPFRIGGGALTIRGDSGTTFVVYGKADGETVDLSNFTPEQGVEITGAMPFGRAGISVANAGDVDGDGINDLIIGAPRVEVTVQTEVDGETSNVTVQNAGAAHIVSGAAIQENGLNLSQLLEGDGGFVIKGFEEEGRIGSNVNAAGDVNGDGLADVIVSGSGSDEAYVVFGKADGTEVDLNNLGVDEGFVVTGTGIENGQLEFANLGDINGDGRDDLAVSVSEADVTDAEGNVTAAGAGTTYVVLGQDNPGAINLDEIAAGNGGFTIEGITANDAAGMSISAAGDINGDGIDDFLVGAPGVDANGLYSDSGIQALINTFLYQQPFSLPADLSPVPLPPGVDLEASLTSIRIENGAIDLTIGALGLVIPISIQGGQVLVFGAPLDGLELNLPIPDTLTLTDADGGAFDFPGDIVEFLAENLDGVAEAFLGINPGSPEAAAALLGPALGALVPGAVATTPIDVAKLILSPGLLNTVFSGGLGAFGVGSPLEFNAGATYVVYGQNGDDISVDLNAIAAGNGGFVINGAAANDDSGWSVSAAGDINGDGYDDLLVGAPGANAEKGNAYVVYGGADAAPVNTPTTGDDNVQGTASQELLVGGLGNDTIDTQGGADVVLAGAGDDTIAISDADFTAIHGGNGADVLRFDAPINLNLASAGDISGIETLDLGTGGAGSTVQLGLSDVFDLTGDNSLSVLGDGSDTLEFLADSTAPNGAWQQTDSEGAVDRYEYVASGEVLATVEVEATVNVLGV